MKIKGIVWLSDILEKLESKHEVSSNEVREVLNSPPLFRYVEKGHRKGEDVYAALGQASSGRYLTVFFVFKRDHRALILSARDMTAAERTLYAKKK